MTTIEDLNEMAASALDSKYTEPGEILFFNSNIDAFQALKKLKNHNFIIGYAFDVSIYNDKFTRIVAYNQKNDIFRGWMKSSLNSDGTYDYIFPFLSDKFSCYLNMPRIGIDGKLKLYKEDFKKISRQTKFSKRMFDNLSYLKNIENIDLYGQYWPILENPYIEELKRSKVCLSDTSNFNNIFYSDMASICNIYKFDETYEFLDDGLKKIYKTLLDNRKLKFCEEVRIISEDPNFEDGLNYFGITSDDLHEDFESQCQFFSQDKSEKRLFFPSLKTGSSSSPKRLSYSLKIPSLFKF